jgi:hypothetical protein
MSDLYFLPTLRRGLARHVASADPGEGGLDAGQVPMGVTVAGTEARQDVSLLAPHRVGPIAADEIVRRYPVPGAVDVETNYFPLVEFRAPDLPWRYTPAGPGTNDRLRPWLALVVVEDGAEGIVYTRAGGAVGRLGVAADQIHQLPPAGELWGWAHAQSSRPVEEAAAAVDDEPDALRSRIVCPRRLEPGRTYRAALVNAFAAGAGERSEPGWGTEPAVAAELTVYDTWTFTTSATVGDFESLCDLLEPASEVGEVGVRSVDVTSPGLQVEWPSTPMLADLVGALADPGAIADDAAPGNASCGAVVEPILDDVLGRAADTADAGDRYDPLTDDPVVGLPFYGSWPAAVTRVPDAGWARVLNLRTTRRMAAGLGARTVRRNQEGLMAAAWDQLGSVREAADELNRGRLSAEVGRSWQARVAAVEEGDRLALAAPLLSFVAVDGTPARELIAGSAAPSALVDRVWMRRAPRASGSSAATAYVDATRIDAGRAQRRAFDYQAVAVAAGVHPIEVQLTTVVDTGSLLSTAETEHVERTGLADTIGGSAPVGDPFGERSEVKLERHDGSPATSPAASASASVAEVADAVAALDPLLSTRAALVARIPALDGLLPSDELPAGLALAPEFTDALFWDLAELDDDVIVPGLGEFPSNRVRLLAVNGAFVGAYLVGANHELAREFLWREYPTDLTATFFQRFFDYGGAPTVDIDPIAGWRPGSALSANVPGAATTTVVLVRGDLVRRYPDVNVFVVPSDADGRPEYDSAVEPSFDGRLGTDALFVGFPVAPEVVLGQTGSPEYLVVFEERMVAPRFGLDVERTGRLTGWDELAWTDFPGSDDHISTGPILGLRRSTFDGVEWGRNAAHLAAAVHQRPYRRLYPATTLLAG